MGDMRGGERQSGERLLVVDDDPSICELLARVLEGEGYQPLICTHPLEALAVSEREDFPLAFVDINLPEMDGLSLAVMLKGHDPRREIVFMTGYGTFDNAVQAIKIGAHDYLRKPFNVSEFVLCLKRFQERKALRERIRQAEQRYLQLVQSIPLLIFVLSDDFRLEFVNKACATILGFPPEEAIGVPGWLLDRIHPEDRGRIEELFRTAFATSVPPFSLECRFLHRKGYLIHGIISSIAASASEIERGSRRIEGVIVNITDRVFLEKAVVQNEKLKTLGAIAAEVAHEIRNPLMSIGGFARRLQKKVPDFPEAEIILRESERLERLLKRIRNYVQPVAIRRERCSVNAVLRDCLDLLSPELERKAVRYELLFDRRLPMAHLDPEILRQIFINLIRNALQAMGKGEALTIKTYESGQNIHVDFRNRIRNRLIKDPELLFLPFDEGGQSIGLPLCYRLLKNMGGLLSLAQSESHVVFTVSLPKMTLPGEAQAA